MLYQDLSSNLSAESKFVVCSCVMYNKIDDFGGRGRSFGEILRHDVRQFCSELERAPTASRAIAGDKPRRELPYQRRCPGGLWKLSIFSMFIGNRLKILINAMRMILVKLFARLSFQPRFRNDILYHKTIIQ